MCIWLGRRHYMTLGGTGERMRAKAKANWVAALVSLLCG